MHQFEQNILRPQLMTEFLYERSKHAEMIENILFGVLLSMFIFDYFILQ